MRCLFILLVALGLFGKTAVADVQITGINDFALGNWSLGDPAISTSIDVCVYSTNLSLPLDGYSVTVSSRTGSFVLKNGSNSLPYSLTWDNGGVNNLGASGGSALSQNVKLGGQRKAGLLNALCTAGVAGPNARLNLKITQADLNAALYGTYSGTIDITISAY